MKTMRNEHGPASYLPSLEKGCLLGRLRARSVCCLFLWYFPPVVCYFALSWVWVLMEKGNNEDSHGTITKWAL